MAVMDGGDTPISLVTLEYKLDLSVLQQKESQRKRKYLNSLNADVVQVMGGGKWERERDKGIPEG